MHLPLRDRVEWSKIKTLFHDSFFFIYSRFFMKVTKVGLIGFGIVGTGVVRLLLTQKERISRQCGQEVRLVKIVDTCLDRKRDVIVPEGMLTDDYRQILDDPEISVVVQLIGGTDAERDIMLRMLRAGKNIVTANKALLATHGEEIFRTARENGVSVAFEAAVAGGIPIIAAISESLAANEIRSIRAILNGTCNFILSRMEKEGSDYASALAEAQRLGYAELNPALDVEGKDATQKIAILSQIAFGARVDWTRILREGITQVSAEDFHHAKSRGYTVRLIAEARRMKNQTVAISVGPAWVKCGTQLAAVDGAYNAVSVEGDAVGHLFFYGPGAGEMPTASAVVADIIDTILGRTAITFRALNLWNENAVCETKLAGAEDIRGEYYLRFPGAKMEAEKDVYEILAKHGISVTTFAESRETPEKGDFSLLTEEISEAALSAALETLVETGVVPEKPVKMRILK